MNIASLRTLVVVGILAVTFSAGLSQAQEKSAAPATQAAAKPKDPQAELLQEIRLLRAEIKRLADQNAGEKKPANTSPPPIKPEPEADGDFAPGSGVKPPEKQSDSAPCGPTEGRGRSASDGVLIRRYVYSLDTGERTLLEGTAESSSPRSVLPSIHIDPKTRFAPVGTYSLPASGGLRSLPTSRIGLEVTGRAFTSTRGDVLYTLPVRTDVLTTSDWSTGHYRGRTVYVTPSEKRPYVIPRNSDVILEGDGTISVVPQ